MRGMDLLVAAAAVTGATAVALGAYGAHGLDADDTVTAMWKTAVSYQMWHALGAIACAWMAGRRDARAHVAALLSGWLMLSGAVLFSGILYYFAIDGTILLYGGAPAGGFMMMAGWIGLAVSALWPQPQR